MSMVFPRVTHVPDTIERVCLVAMAAGNLMVAYVVHTLDTCAEGVLPWPLFFVGSALALAWWAASPGSRIAYAASGALCIGAYVGRSIALVIEYGQNSPTHGSDLVGSVIWGIAAILVFVAWRHLRPARK